MEDKIQELYNASFNELKSKKKYAPVVTSVLKVLKENKDPITIRDAIKILEDSKNILLQVTNF